MKQTKAIIAVLKKVLKQQGLTYAELAQSLQLSESNVKRMFSKATLTIHRLESICEILDVDIYQLAKLAAAGDQAVEQVLSEDQEAALVADANLLTVLYLLLNGYNYESILNGYEIAKEALTSHLIELDRIGLIELHPGNRVKLKIKRSIRWQRGGLFQKIHETVALQDFLDTSFEDSDQDFLFSNYQLSTPSAALVMRKLKKLRKEVSDLSEIDSLVPPAQKTDVGLLFAIRPWLFSAFRSLQKKPLKS